MFERTAPTLWSLTCPECGDHTIIEIPIDAEPGTGLQRCRNDHEFLFQFDGMLVGVLGFGAAQARRL